MRGALVLLGLACEVVVIRLLMHRAFQRGYRAAKATLGVHSDGTPCVRPGTGCNTRGCPDTAEYWDRQWALSQEPKRA